MDSYDDILKRMVDSYSELSGFVPNEESDIMLRFRVLAGELYSNLVAQKYLKEQMFAVTASADYLDKHATVRGLERKQATYSTGELTFSLSQTALEDVLIPKGVVASTNSSQALRFKTTIDAVIPTGAISVTVPAQAVESGVTYNVKSKQVSVIVTPPAGVVAVTNNKAFTGGTDKESDQSLRQRVLYSYQDISNGTNAIYYKRLAESVPGVYSAGVVPRERGNGTVDVYISSKGEDVTYKEVEQVQQLLDENRELNVDVMVWRALSSKVCMLLELEVVDGYAFEDVKAELESKITEFVACLGVGKPMYLKDICDLIYHTDGVKNFCLPESSNFDVFPGDTHYCVMSEFDIRQVSAW